MSKRRGPSRKYGKSVDALLRLDKNANEAMIKNCILKLLDVEDINYSLEYKSSVGPTDIHLMHRCTIIETKTAKRLEKGPYESGTGSKKRNSSNDVESAYEQLVRYVAAYKKQRLLTASMPWRGVVTDGRHWWIWEWRDTDNNARSEIRTYGGWEGRVISHDNVPDLVNILQRDHPGKPWAPANPTHLFKDQLIGLNEIYSQNKVLSSTKIQKELWSEQLKASGNYPNTDTESDSLFVTHTLLILISRLISGIRITKSASVHNNSLTAGFVGWVDNSMVFIKNLQSIVDRYDWGAIHGDVMRSLYINFVPQKQRELYGEYYTPDWLAEKICREVIDEEYIDEQLDRYLNNKKVQGIIDPACGSGTFLYQAARHIYNSEPMLKSGLGRTDIADFLSRILIGVDIHPVAVEMSIANVSRVLGNVDLEKLHIYQGDSLLAERSTTTVYSAGMNTMTIHAYKNVLTLPLSILNNRKNIDLFVNSARLKKSMPKIIEKDLDVDDIEVLSVAYKNLTKMIEKLGDGVWAWYIRNQAAPILLSQGLRPKRIVSNPPWVRNSKITDINRKKQIRKLGTDYDVYVGGKMANVFDLASVFVARCVDLYLAKDGKAGWVLPDTAAYGAGQWEKLRKKYKFPIQFWNLGSIPFPEQSPACTMLINVGTGSILRLDVKKGYKVNQYDSWEKINDGIAKLVVDELLTKKQRMSSDQSTPSAWLSTPKKAIARQGATIVPSVLVRVDPKSIVKADNSQNATFQTQKSIHGVWKNMRQLEGTVPYSWIKKCTMAKNMYPFRSPSPHTHTHTHTQCILPIDSSGHWIVDRSKVTYWKNICALYEKNRGTGSATPPTLEARLDYGRALLYQTNQKPPFVIYNKAGNRLYATVANNPIYVDSTLYRVSCASYDEAYFLSAILNSDVIQDLVDLCKGNTKDIHTYFWWKIPIPRFDQNSILHKKLSTLGKSAEDSVNLFVEKHGDVTRKKILEMLRSTSLLPQIDDIVGNLIKSGNETWD